MNDKPMRELKPGDVIILTKRNREYIYIGTISIRSNGVWQAGAQYQDEESKMHARLWDDFQDNFEVKD